MTGLRNRTKRIDALWDLLQDYLPFPASVIPMTTLMRLCKLAASPVHHPFPPVFRPQSPSCRQTPSTAISSALFKTAQLLRQLGILSPLVRKKDNRFWPFGFPTIFLSIFGIHDGHFPHRTTTILLEIVFIPWRQTTRRIVHCLMAEILELFLTLSREMSMGDPSKDFSAELR